MKIKFLPLILGTVFAFVAMTSCLNNKDEEVIEYSNQSAITAFSLGKLKVKVATSHGDSIYYIDGSKYPFTINQQTLTIQNNDSLPYGTDLSKVVVTVKGSTNTIVYKPVNSNGTQRNDTLWINTDSLNFAFNNTLQFKVIAQSGVMSLPYTVKLNVHQQNPELMVWKTMQLPFEAFSPRSVYYTENPHSRLDVLGVTKQDTILNSAWIVNGEFVLGDGTGSKWSGVDVNFMTVVNGLFSFANKLPLEDATQLWMCPFHMDSVLYVVQHGKFATAKFEDEYLTFDQIQPGVAPTRFSSVVIPVNYNPAIRRMIIAQQNPAGTSANVYQRLTNDENGWMKYEQPVPAYRCPNFEAIKIAYYDGKLIAFGEQTAEIEAFSAVYESSDYGLTWRKSASLTLPTEEFKKHYATSEGHFSIFTDENHYLWVVWADGTVHRGRLNRFETNTTK